METYTSRDWWNIDVTVIWHESSNGNIFLLILPSFLRFANAMEKSHFMQMGSLSPDSAFPVLFLGRSPDELRGR
jgi:hypothetical protein